MFVNMTPHAIVVRKADGTEIVFPPSGRVPRVSSQTLRMGEVEGVELRTTFYGDVEGLPEVVEGTFLIVSGMIKDRFPEDRPDLVAPDTGPSAIRDESGRIIAVTGLRN